MVRGPTLPLPIDSFTKGGGGGGFNPPRSERSSFMGNRTFRDIFDSPEPTDRRRRDEANQNTRDNTSPPVD